MKYHRGFKPVKVVIARCFGYAFDQLVVVIGALDVDVHFYCLFGLGNDTEGA